MYVKSREDLGNFSQTKRPTSVVMLLKPPEDHKYLEVFNTLIEAIKAKNPYLKK
jgi:hypothetical protein